NTFSYEIADNIIKKEELDSQGIYTSIGTYDIKEMKLLVRNLSLETKISENDLYYKFGEYLFDRFRKLYPHFFEMSNNSFDFLKKIENIIHIEVKKLYPDSELPKFEFKDISENEMIMSYISERNIPYLAKGLISKTFNFFNENIDIKMESSTKNILITNFYLIKKE
ncbi:MAG: heme NO-binding domain-containing protein, partial [Candidatus Sericytochromatia bacterium]